MGETRAVVIGASIAGLLTARVLAESYDRVTVYERDTLADAAQPRQGVPQSRQAHVLQARGLSALDELLPGFAADLIAAGAAPADQQLDVHWYLDDHLLFPAASGLTGIGITRRRLEWMIRGRVAKVPGVEIAEATAVEGIVVEGAHDAPGARVPGGGVPGGGASGGGDVTNDGTAAGGWRDRVTGVRVRPAGTPGADVRDCAGPHGAGTGAAGDVVAADLVVDAGGRGTRTPAWLAELGYPQAPVTELRTDVIYVTRHYRATPEQLNGLGAAVYTPYPGKHHGGALIRQEADQWVVLIAGMLGEDPPASGEGFLEYAKSFAGPEMATVLTSSEPVDDPVKMRFPGSVRHHYDKLDRFPDGLLVTGDALCSFNPIYGQGMTVAALEALALRGVISSGATGNGGPTGLSARFAAAAAAIVDEAWSLSASGDLRFPQVEGTRKLTDRIANAYLDRFRHAASVDPALGKAFVRVANMIDPPAKLLTPGNVVRVFQARRKATKALRLRARRTVPGSVETMQIGT
jgi:2-polyprenyl-6-methoxyphenol hydroxylase-like FAD-dependent oxidoreductase